MSFEISQGRRRRSQSGIGLWAIALVVLIAAAGGGMWLVQSGRLQLPAASSSSPASAARAPYVTAPVQVRGRGAEDWGKQLQERDADAALAAARALGQMGEDGVPYLIRGLSVPFSDVRVECGRALLKYPDALRAQKEKVVPALIKMLNSGNREEWIAAVKLLGEMGTAARAAILPLEELRDKTETAADKQMVVKALASITK